MSPVLVQLVGSHPGVTSDRFRGLGGRQWIPGTYTLCSIRDGQRKI